MRSAVPPATFIEIVVIINPVSPPPPISGCQVPAYSATEAGVQGAETGRALPVMVQKYEGGGYPSPHGKPEEGLI